MSLYSHFSPIPSPMALSPPRRPSHHHDLNGLPKQHNPAPLVSHSKIKTTLHPTPNFDLLDTDSVQLAW